MLRFYEPGSFEEGLLATYEHLMTKLQLLLGYPATLVTWPPQYSKRSFVDRDGGQVIALPSTGGPKSVFRGLRLPSEAKGDPYPRKVVGLFAAKCASLLNGISRRSDLKRAIIQLEAFLWDDIAISLLHGGGGRWNSLDLIQTV